MSFSLLLWPLLAFVSAQFFLPHPVPMSKTQIQAGCLNLGLWLLISCRFSCLFLVISDAWVLSYLPSLCEQRGRGWGWKGLVWVSMLQGLRAIVMWREAALFNGGLDFQVMNQIHKQYTVDSCQYDILIYIIIRDLVLWHTCPKTTLKKRRKPSFIFGGLNV